ncbi:hypothetical protein VTN96DRAFT_7166 [Rasamsonia emersonii]
MSIRKGWVRMDSVRVRKERTARRFLNDILTYLSKIYGHLVDYSSGTSRGATPP